MTDIIQLKITLLNISPKIWRRVWINKKSTLFELHYVIQIAMGWTNSHLHEFQIRDNKFADPYEGMNDDTDIVTLNSRTINLENLHPNKGLKFRYLYDFGDSWMHEVLVEKEFSSDEKVKLPVCLEGKNNCPPEDCGSVPGFYRMLEIIKNKNDEEHEDMLEWLGGSYDPKEFNVDAVNKEFKAFKKIVKEAMIDE